MKVKEYHKIELINPLDCISGKIMKCNRIIANVFRRNLKPHNITDSQLSYLFIISKKKSINQHRLASILVMDKSTVNRNLTRLIGRKLIKTNKDKEIKMTKSGQDFLEKVIPSWNNAMKEIENDLGVDGISALNTLLNTLNNKIK